MHRASFTLPQPQRNTQPFGLRAWGGVGFWVNKLTGMLIKVQSLLQSLQSSDRKTWNASWRKLTLEVSNPNPNDASRGSEGDSCTNLPSATEERENLSLVDTSDQVTQISFWKDTDDSPAFDVVGTVSTCCPWSCWSQFKDWGGTAENMMIK